MNLPDIDPESEWTAAQIADRLLFIKPSLIPQHVEKNHEQVLHYVNALISSGVLSVEKGERLVKDKNAFIDVYHGKNPRIIDNRPSKKLEYDFIRGK